MKTWATKQIQLRGWTREPSIIEITGMDGVDQDEAERRYDWAVRVSARRRVAQTQSHQATRKAQDHALRDYRSGRMIAYDEALARRFKRYRTAYWDTLLGYETGELWP